MELEYQLDEIPPKKVLITLSLQWFAIIAAILIIGGRIVAEIQFENPTDRIGYIQKIFLISGITMLAQLFIGHRLPLVVGPASVLIAGIYASMGSDFSTIYTAIAIGGVVIFFFGITGSLNLLRKLFTENIVAVVLILVAITLSPLIMEMITLDTPNAGYNFAFSILFVIMLFILNKKLRGFWNSSLILWSLILGSAVYSLIFPQHYEILNPDPLNVFSEINITHSFRLEVIISFMICFFALAINDLSSIYSLAGTLKLEDTEFRAKRGVTLTGLSNILSGFFGVIGSVNYSMSPGIISATKCASRYALVPAGFILLILAFTPFVISLIEAIPKVVIGSVFLYIMCSQVAVGIPMIKFKDTASGFVIGFPLLLSIIVTFLPESVLTSFPEILRPIIGNGFVLGVLVAMLMEHVILRRDYEN
ncbi:MAG: solute carrier family 23 protein [Archaeoglobaceae archaeon]